MIHSNIDKNKNKCIGIFRFDRDGELLLKQDLTVISINSEFIIFREFFALNRLIFATVRGIILLKLIPD